MIDEGLTLNTYYQDADGDGYGNASISLQDCSQLAGYVSNSQDCDDTNAGVHPNVIEICDSKDNNCNGQIDEGFTKQTYYLDADGDGFGDPVFSIQACSQPPGYVTTRTDNCPSVPNADQKDLDRDGLGDACDPVTNVAAALDALASDINRMVSQGWKNGLIAKLNEVKASCAQGNINAGANQLGAFINQVNAKRGKGLTDAQADDLIARANAVITAMNRGSSDCGMALKSVPGISFKELPIEEVEQHTKGITLQAIPNPSTSYFTLRVRSNGSNLPISLRVIDLYGRVVEDKVIDANCTVQIGASYRAGVYFAELIQRNEKVIVKLIKY